MKLTSKARSLLKFIAENGPPQISIATTEQINTVRQLRRAGLVEYTGDRWRLTDEGRSWLAQEGKEP